MTYRIRKGVVLVTVQNVYLIVASAPCWDICPYIVNTNEMGAFIWEQLEQNREVNDIVAMICKEYEADDLERIEDDVNLFIQNLKESNYLIQDRSDTE